MTIRPLYDRIVVKRMEETQQMQGGLHIPDSAKEKPQEAEVIAVGKGKRLEDGKVATGREIGRPHPVRQIHRQRDQAGWRGIPDRARRRSARRIGRR